jgi:hypothetical protein
LEIAPSPPAYRGEKSADVLWRKTYEKKKKEENVKEKGQTQN